MGSSNATCIELGPKQGGLTLACRECDRSGYQPFAGASALEFWIKDMNGSSTIPDVQVCGAVIAEAENLAGYPESADYGRLLTCDTPLTQTGFSCAIQERFL